jgi:hypothetical protein
LRQDGVKSIHPSPFEGGVRLPSRELGRQIVEALVAITEDGDAR